MNESNGRTAFFHASALARRPERVRTVGVAAAAIFAWWFQSRPEHPVLEILGPLATCIGGYPLFRKALEGLAGLHLTIELPLTLAILVALAVGSSSTALTIVLFAFLTKTVERYLVSRTARLTDELTRSHFSSTFIRLKPAEYPAPVQCTARWLLGFLICLSLAAALLTVLSTRDLGSAIPVLVVVGAAGLTCGTSLPDLAGRSQSAARGLILKRTASFDQLASISVVVLDGDSVQLSSAHPFLSGAKQAIELLGTLDIEVILFTADLQPVAQAAAARLGFKAFEAELFPEDKPCKIAALQRANTTVALLSDGLRDGGALREADVAVVIGPLKAENHIAFCGESLCDFAEVLAIARSAKHTAAFNTFATILVASLGIGFALCGALPVSWALSIRFTSEVMLMLNAARLLQPVQKHAHAQGQMLS